MPSRGVSGLSWDDFKLAPRFSWREIRSAMAFGLDNIVSGFLSVASVVLQERILASPLCFDAPAHTIEAQNSDMLGGLIRCGAPGGASRAMPSQLWQSVPQLARVTHRSATLSVQVHP